MGGCLALSGRDQIWLALSRGFCSFVWVFFPLFFSFLLFPKVLCRFPPFQKLLLGFQTAASTWQ